MTRRYKRGLVVGKFCPLHRGHEFLIRRAQAACGELLVISYAEPCPPGYEAAKRERWLARRFPDLRAVVIDAARLAALCRAAGIGSTSVLPPDAAPDDEHRHFVAWICLDLLGLTVDAVFTSEDYGDGFARVLASRFGHAVDHVCVDRARAAVPVSGTLLRADPHAHREFLAPDVYADFVRRVAVLGGESSGKTTLAAALAARLNTRWAPEYGRELWEAKDGRLDFDDMPHIAQIQVAREEKLAQEADRWLICDTTPLTTYFYSREMFGSAAPTLRRLSERPYDLTLLCAPDFGFVQDGTRRGADFRAVQDAWYRAELGKRKIPFHPLEGPPERRLAVAESLLAGLGFPAAGRFNDPYVD